MVLFLAELWLLVVFVILLDLGFLIGVTSCSEVII